MKKFTKYTEEKVKENKTFNKHMELTQDLFECIKDKIHEKGYEVEEENLNDYIFEHISEISKVLIDPSTLPDKPGTQTDLKFDQDQDQDQ